MPRKRDQHEEVFDSLNTQIIELEAQLKIYRDKEQAIVEALTQAQTMAAQRAKEAEHAAAMRIEEAENQAKAVIENAEAASESANARAERIIAEAQEKAYHITLEAKERANRYYLDVEKALVEYEGRLASFNAILVKQAESAREASNAYALTMEATLVDRTGLLREEFGEVEAVKNADNLAPVDAMDAIFSKEETAPVAAAEAQETAPKDNVMDAIFSAPVEAEKFEATDDPRELIKNIYKIEKRDIPEHDEEEEVPTVNEVMKKAEKDEEPLPPSVDLDALLQEIILDR